MLYGEESDLSDMEVSKVMRSSTAYPLPLRQSREQVAPLLELTTPKALLLTLQWQVIGLIALMCHIVLIRDGTAACFVLLMAGLLGLHRVNPLAGFIVYLQLLLYQNVVVSVFSGSMSSSDYTVVSATSFVAGLVLASAPVLRIIQGGSPFRSNHRGITRTMRLVLIAIGVALAYTALGAVVAGPTQAVVGFRNATALLFAIVLGLDIGDRWSYRTVATCFLASIVLGVFLSLIEISDPAWYLSLVHAADFGNLKNYQSVKAHLFAAENVIDTMTSLPFNSGLLTEIFSGTTYRFGGPNMHSISYGYVLAISGLILLSLGRFGLAVPLGILVFMIGVKGAAILFIATGLLYQVWRITANLKFLLACGFAFAAVYIGYGVTSGLAAGDFHALGFIGGVNGFLENPLGHGIGVGGNLSLGTLTETKWQEFQHTGAANVGLESAVGVLIYQIGIGCVAMVVAIIALLRAGSFGVAWRKPKLTDLLFIGLCMGLVNGVFQEEAYSPYAVGLLALFCGVLVANGRRTELTVDPEERPL